MTYSFEPIAVVRSCFKEKFGIPRQGILIPEAMATIEFLSPFGQPDALRGIEAYSHLWIVFVFHANPAGRFKATVRPPRLGGNRRIGVFASRSGFRPNPIGLSLVALERVYHQKERLYLDVRGADLLDGTPVLDIKPYLPWADKPDQAAAGFADRPPLQDLQVEFSAEVEAFLSAMPAGQMLHLKTLITQMLLNDPRPAIDPSRFARKEYGASLYDWNIRWKADGKRMRVTAITPMNAQSSSEASISQYPELLKRNM